MKKTINLSKITLNLKAEVLISFSKYTNLVTFVVSKLVKLLNWRKGGNVINHFSIVIVLSVATEHCGKKNYVNWILNTRDLEMDIR